MININETICCIIYDKWAIINFIEEFEDKFWYNESKKGLEFSNNNFWNGMF